MVSRGKKQWLRIGRIPALVSGLVLLVHTMLAAALPLVSEMKIIGGARGVVISFGADESFRAEFSQKGDNVTAIFDGCIYGLPSVHYSNFPHQIPLESITARQINTARVEITIEGEKGAFISVRAIQKGRLWMLLLTDKPVAVCAWNSSMAAPVAKSAAPVAKSAAPVAKSAAPVARSAAPVARSAAPVARSVAPVAVSMLRNIRLVERDSIGVLTLEFDRPVVEATKRSGDLILVRFSGARSALDKRVMQLPKESAFRSVAVREKIQDRLAVLEVTVRVKKARVASGSNVVVSRGATYSLYVMQKVASKALLWTSGKGLVWSYPFYNVPSYNVDMQSIGQQARKDLSKEFAAETTFSIGNNVSGRVANGLTPKTTVHEKPLVEAGLTDGRENSADSMVVVADIVNFRATPALQGNVVTQLLRGAIVRVIERKKNWVKVQYGTHEGYIYATLVKNQHSTDTSQSEQPADAGRAETVQIALQQEVVPAATPELQNRARSSSADVQTAVDDAADSVVAALSKAKRVVRYHARGRDPFKPLLADTVGFAGKPSVENLSLVGILVDDNDRIALCEDVSSGRRPFALREHDQVEGGRVLKIYQDKVVFLVTEYGISRSFTLRLKSTSPEQEASRR